LPQDPRVDAYIAKAADFARPILTHLRAVVHSTVDGLDETIKWGMPHFVYKGKNLAGFAAFKAHTAFILHGDGRQGEGMGGYGKIASRDELPSDAELALAILSAKARIDETGTALKPRAAARTPKQELPIPPAFAAALAANPTAEAAFRNFAPSHRREYIQWISDAKRDETREKRIVQAIEWLNEGKKRNWKYENC